MTLEWERLQSATEEKWKVKCFIFFVYFAVTTWVLTHVENQKLLFCVFFVISNLKSVFNPLALQISLVILLIVCHRIIDDNLEKLGSTGYHQFDYHVRAAIVIVTVSNKCHNSFIK